METKFRGCAPLQYKRIVCEGTVQRVFRITSNRKKFDRAMKKIGKHEVEINVRRIGRTG